MKTIVLMVALAASLLGMQSCAAQQSIDLKGAFLVDVRTPQEVASGGVAGALNIPLNELGQRLAEFDNKGQIVVFCRSGARSAQAKTILEKNGYTNVVNGGTWQQVQAKLDEGKKE